MFIIKYGTIMYSLPCAVFCPILLTCIPCGLEFFSSHMDLKMISWDFHMLPCIYQNVATITICMSYLWHHSGVYFAVLFRLMFLDDDLMYAHTVKNLYVQCYATSWTCIYYKLSYYVHVSNISVAINCAIQSVSK